jgi:hypothetical protein
MAFWWSLLVLAFAFAICKFLLILIPPKVPSIDVDASDGNLPHSLIHSLVCYIAFKFVVTLILIIAVLEYGNQSQENRFIYVSDLLI